MYTRCRCGAAANTMLGAPEECLCGYAGLSYDGVVAACCCQSCSSNAASSAGMCWQAELMQCVATCNFVTHQLCRAAQHRLQAVWPQWPACVDCSGWPHCWRTAAGLGQLYGNSVLSSPGSRDWVCPVNSSCAPKALLDLGRLLLRTQMTRHWIGAGATVI